MQYCEKTGPHDADCSFTNIFMSSKIFHNMSKDILEILKKSFKTGINLESMQKFILFNVPNIYFVGHCVLVVKVFNS